MGYGLKASPRDITRILNSNIANEPGMFALDAIQANPNVEGTLGNKISILENNLNELSTDVSDVKGAAIDDKYDYVDLISTTYSALATINLNYNLSNYKRLVFIIGDDSNVMNFTIDVNLLKN